MHHIELLKMKINIELTFSKIFSLILLLSSIYLSIKLKDAIPFITVVPIVGGIIVNKQYNDRRKNNEKNTID